ncbi:MAG: hypothetical protein EP298_10985 [Gammaproteobacteria bacterium]|nr:MAG: hypothetical protein EP298_10985 [Gammaproteobacteria bacterium]UTW41599.1 hypothetical protein KFE69_08775 [bacterium SCSIO 12844]
MKFDKIVNLVKIGQLETLTPEVLKLLGERYLEKYPEKSLFHSNQAVANLLVTTSSCIDDVKNSTKSAITLIDVLGLLPNLRGELAVSISKVLNKVMKSDISLTYCLPGEHGLIIDKTPESVVEEFKQKFDKAYRFKSDKKMQKLFLFYKENYKGSKSYEMRDLSKDICL